MINAKRLASVILAAGMMLAFIPAAAMASSAGWQKEDGNWLYVKSDGSLTVGWKKISKKWYYFNEAGVMETGLCNIGGTSYYFDKNGAMKTGWVKDDGEWYYFKKDGSGVVSDWVKSGGKWYYFNECGTMETDVLEIDGVLYYFGSSGALVTGWYKDDYNSFYFTTNGMVKGWKKIDGKWYYFDKDDGAMTTGIYDIEGTLYNFGSTGALVTGWYEDDSGNKYYCTSDGIVKGWQKIDGSWYCFDDDGMMFTEFKIVEDKLYYFGSDGKMYSAQWYKDEEGNWFYFTKSGAAYTDNEWHKIGNNMYLFDETGCMIDEKIDPNSLSNTMFKDPYTKNNEDIVAWAWNAYNNKWGYMYGTYGNILTQSHLNDMASKHPNDVGKYKDYLKKNCVGIRTTDCVGLIKGYMWYNPDKQEVVYGYGKVTVQAGANATYKNATVKGPLSTMPDIPGLGVYHNGHVGIYVGNGMVIHAPGNGKVVSLVALDDMTSFTHWFKIPGVSYPD